MDKSIIVPVDESNLVLLAFQNTSSETLVRGMDFPTVLLPSDKIKDSEIAITKIQTSEKIICFGQKPQIKNKICLELVTRDNDALLPTNFEIETLKTKLKKPTTSPIPKVKTLELHTAILFIGMP